MVDIHETPAVPPFDPQGDERFGYFVAGGLLIAAGWGVAVALNVALHAVAGPGGIGWWFGLHVGRAWGAEGWAVAIFGALTGAFGIALIGFGRTAPRGPVVLPGAEY